MEGKTALLIFCLTLVMSEATANAGNKYRKYCRKAPGLSTNCLDIRCHGAREDGVYTIYPTGNLEYNVQVYCDQTTDGGGWTVFQRRMNGEEEFYRKWKDYQLGFGDLNGEFWLGNDLIATLAAQKKNNELRVDLVDWNDTKVYAEYSTFGFGDEADLYKLEVSGYSGNAGNSLSYHNGMNFSTYDSDNDPWDDVDCAVAFHGAWWYRACHTSNLNGRYVEGGDHTNADGISWRYNYGYFHSMKVTEMKYRRELPK